MLEKFKNKLLQKGDLYLRIKVRPGVSKSEAVSLMDDDTIKINIAAAPEKGKANAELINFLSKEFGVGKSQVKIISGQAEKLKLLKINL
jgi:hypothetical protein